jgi:hypothetical protein
MPVRLRPVVCTIFALSFLWSAPAIADSTITTTEVQGTWKLSNSPIRIQHTVNVPNRASLTVEAGVTVLLDAGTQLRVEGDLFIEGTASDSVVFTSADTTGFSTTSAQTGGWKGIHIAAKSSAFDPFTNHTDTSVTVRYCALRFAKQSSALTIIGRNASLSHVSISHTLESSTGGLKISTSRATLRDCSIGNNNCYTPRQIIQGGGIHCFGSYLYADHCRIFNNRATSQIRRYGGGLYADQSIALLDSCEIAHNESGRGGAVYASGSDLSLTSSRIYNNSSQSGAALYLIRTLAGGNEITDCWFYNNASARDIIQVLEKTIIANCALFSNATQTGHPITMLGSNNTVRHSIVWGNSIAESTTEGIGIYESGNSVVNSIIQNNGPLNSAEIYLDSPLEHTRIAYCGLSPYGPFTIPDNCITDPAVFRHASGDTVSASTITQLDWRMAPNSPFIDGGDPVSRLDPDSSVSDIGVYTPKNQLAGTGPYPNEAAVIPLHIKSDLTVFDPITLDANDTLIIDPGVTLRFARNAGIFGNGVLRINGTAHDSVILTDLSNEGWSGIALFGRVYSSVDYNSHNDEYTNNIQTNHSEISYTRISNSLNHAISLRECSLLVYKSTLGNNAGFVYGDQSARIALDSCLLWGSTALNGHNRISLSNRSRAKISGNRIDFAGTGSIRAINVPLLTIEHNTIQNAATSIATTHCDRLLIEHNTFLDSRNSHISLTQQDSTHIGNNTILRAGAAGILAINVLRGQISGNNISHNQGSGISIQQSSFTICNNTITQNQSKVGGGAFLLASRARICNTVIAGNRADSAAHQLYAKAGTFTYWENGVNDTSALTITNSVIASGESGYIITDPRFSITDTWFNDPGLDTVIALTADGVTTVKHYPLSTHSICIDQGLRDTSRYFVPRFDILGNQRMRGKAIDIGAYEYSATSTTTTRVQPVLSSLSVTVHNGATSPRLQMHLPVEQASAHVALQLYDLSGRKVLSRHTRACNQRALFSLTGTSGLPLAAGNYLYRVSVERQRHTGRLILSTRQ